MTRVRAHALVVRRGGAVVLDGAELEVGPGLHALVGDNGAGKSTLLRALAGVQSLFAGTIEIDGHDLWREPVAARLRLGYLPESPELFPYLTPRELLRTVNAVRGVDPRAGEELVARWIRPAALDLRIGTLSAGQRRKVALAAALAHEPPVLLLDEPTNALDAAAVADLCALSTRWRDDGRVVLVATHRPEALGLAFDARWVVRERRVHPG